MENNELSELPYITSNMPGIGGKIKETPEDFVVEEIPLYEPLGTGKHLYVNITKKGETTKEIVGKIRSAFNLNETDIGVAGLKDKFSVSTQTLSISLDRIKVSDEEIKEKINTITRVNWVKRHNNKLRPGHLIGNRFKILIRGVDKDAMQKALKIIDIIEV